MKRDFLLLLPLAMAAACSPPGSGSTPTVSVHFGAKIAPPAKPKTGWTSTTVTKYGEFKTSGTGKNAVSSVGNPVTAAELGVKNIPDAKPIPGETLRETTSNSKSFAARFWTSASPEKLRDHFVPQVASSVAAAVSTGGSMSSCQVAGQLPDGSRIEISAQHRRGEKFAVLTIMRTKSL